MACYERPGGGDTVVRNPIRVLIW